MSIISFYMIYFSEKYENEKLENINISKKIYIHYKMLELIELREILKTIDFKILKNEYNSKEYELFYLLVNYSEKIEILINSNENENKKNLTIKMVKDNKIFNLNEIENIKEYLKFSNGINNIYIKTILEDNYSGEYLTYKFPKVLFNDNNKNIGNLFWFFKIFAKKYLQNEFIDLDPLEEFNDAIEYLLLKSEISNNKFKSIWNNELEKIMNNGYLLIDALKPMFSKKK